MTTSRNIAGTVGRWSATHRKTAIAGWVVFVIAAFMVGNMTGTQKLTDTQSGVGDSGTAAKVVDKRDALFKTNAQIEAAAPIAPTGN